MSQPEYVEGPRLDGSVGLILDPKWVNKEFDRIEAKLLQLKLSRGKPND